MTLLENLQRKVQEKVAYEDVKTMAVMDAIVKDVFDTLLTKLESDIQTVRCIQNKYSDDGIHITYKCLGCGQMWGEEQETPICLDPAIRLKDILTLLSTYRKEV